MRRNGKKRIFLLLLLFWGAAGTLHAEVSLSGKVFLEREYSHGEDEAFLRTLLRQVDSFGRLEETARPTEKLVLRLRAKEFRYLPGEKRSVLEIPGSSREWQTADTIREKLILFFLCRRFLFTPKELHTVLNREDFPFWLTSAAEKAMQASRKEGIYFRSNRDFSEMRTLNATTGTLPDFTVLTSMQKELMGKSERRCFRESSLILAELFCRRKMMKDYLRDITAGRSFSHWLTHFASAEKADQILRQEARPVLWNSLAPMPAAMFEKELPRLETLTVLRTDETGSPEIRNLPIAEAAALMNEKNPDTPKIRKTLVQKCRDFGAQSPPEISRAVKALASAAEALDSDQDTIDAYFGELQKLREIIAKEKKKEAFFQQEARKVRPVLPAWQESFDALSPADSAMSDAVAAFLEETEKRYLSEY